jgi:hypothetical protein
MNASWGKAKFRTEVWDDDVNPSDDWWRVYAPSEEEIDAALANFSFGEVEQWCEDKGLNFEDAQAKYQKDLQGLMQNMEADVEAELGSPLAMEDFKVEQAKFFELQKKAFKLAFRLSDDENQKKKGQPSLDDEDDGTRFFNDPVEV